jgi:hypothetical protein
VRRETVSEPERAIFDVPIDEKTARLLRRIALKTGEEVTEIRRAPDGPWEIRGFVEGGRAYVEAAADARPPSHLISLEVMRMEFRLIGPPWPSCPFRDENNRRCYMRLRRALENEILLPGLSSLHVGARSWFRERFRSEILASLEHGTYRPEPGGPVRTRQGALDLLEGHTTIAEALFLAEANALFREKEEEIFHRADKLIEILRFHRPLERGNLERVFRLSCSFLFQTRPPTESVVKYRPV